MDKIVVLDFGGQYAHLIANRIRRLGYYSEIKDGNTQGRNLKNYKGIVLSGGPASVIEKDSILADPEIFELGVPILGICYGHQVISHLLGGKVTKGKVREYGKAIVDISLPEAVFEGLTSQEQVWMSHFDQVTELPQGFQIAASTNDCPIAGMLNFEKKIYGVQFHPEVTHTPNGTKILENFLEITEASKEWDLDYFIDLETKKIQEKVGKKKVFLMISGGVDSSVAFLLLNKALGQDRVYGLFVDTGFMRYEEGKEVEKFLRKAGVKNLHIYNAKEEYFSALENIYDPEEKRKIIGDLFLDIKDKVADDLNLDSDEWFLGQGTIYPDTIETGGTKHAHTIKTHHNRVDKIQKLIEEGKVIEPIADLYKDEVRIVGEKLGLSKDLVERHPFPGPGLAIRILCSNEDNFPQNHKKVEEKINQNLSAHDLDFCKKLLGKILPIQSVGVQGDERTYRHPLAIFPEKFNLEKINWENLEKISTQITNEFSEINRVVFALNYKEEGVSTNQKVNLTTRKSFLTSQRTKILQEADKIVMDFIKEKDIYKEIWQFPSVLIPIIDSVDDQSDQKESLVLRPIWSKEAMTANFYQMRANHLNELVKRLENLDYFSYLFYDLTNKPPGTIEWE